MKDNIRILLTEKCNATCKNCFNKDYREDFEIPINVVEPLAVYLSRSGIKSLKIMGGEPTIHTSFTRCIDIFQRYFYRISIFTNGISENIRKINIRDNDCIVLNYNFFNVNVDINKLLLNLPGSRVLEIQISKDTDENKLVNSLIKLNNYSNLISEKVGINITLDCMINIFDDSAMTIIAQKWNKIFNYLIESTWHYNIDHNIPLCLSKKYKLYNETSKMCTLRCCGLIDSSLNLRYCNQNPKILTNIIDGKGFIEFKDIINILQKELEEKSKFNEKLYCRNCELYFVECNGGCFVHKNVMLNK